MVIKFNDDHEKVVAIAIVALLFVSVAAIIFAYLAGLGGVNASALITLAGAAVGGIAGFITHKATTRTNGSNGPNLNSPIVPVINVGEEVKIALQGSSPNSLKLTYMMEMQPKPVNPAEIDLDTGAFSWLPDVKEVNTLFNVTFVVADDHGGSDSKIINFKVNP
jgi:hypothetical protein